MLTIIVRSSANYNRGIPQCPNCGRLMYRDAVRSSERDVFKCGECGIWAVHSARNGRFGNDGAPEASN
jgi:predicted RNA-binding Zn-ribbon protein involved in translation (DUF1610 family)